MRSVVVQTPAQQEHVGIGRLNHLRNDGDRATFADQYGLHTETFFYGPHSPLHKRRIGVGHYAATAMQIDQFNAHTRRCMLREKGTKLFGNSLGVLIGH